jgi:RNA polymerase sigma-70 factor, ECF subfamily
MLAEQPPTSFGSDKEFGQVFLQYYRPVLYVVRRHGFSEEDARELTQETFLRVYKGWREFRGEAQLSTWIFQIARNIALNEIRSRTTLKRDAPEVSLEEVYGPDGERGGGIIRAQEGTGINPLEVALAAEKSRALRGALEELPPQMKRCVRLRIDRDLKYREIGELMSISIDTVKAHLFQARQILREKLSNYFSDFDNL